MAEKVLIVDDDKDFLEVMSERLQTRGINVSTAERAEDALKRLERDIFDVIILDLQMPGIDGIETLKQIKEKHEALQVIMLTGHATVEKGVEAIKLGATDFIEKPADIDVLNDKIKKAKKKKMLIMDKMDYERMIETLKRFGI
jgi:DNA-binding NtrC family response regulator